MLFDRLSDAVFPIVIVGIALLSVLWNALLAVPLAIICAVVWYCGLHLVRVALTSYANKHAIPIHVPVAKRPRGINIDKLKQPNVCSVCTSPDCERKQIPAHGFQKLVEAEIPENVNIALERFFTRCIEDYVKSWYDGVSNDPAFVHEIRQIYYRAVNYVYRRIRCFDLTDFILEDVFPIALQHGDTYLDMQRKFSHADQQLLESLIIDSISKKSRLHRAAMNRNAEIRYLRQLAAFIVDSSVPKDARKSAAARKFAVETFAFMVLLPLMDILADPDTINYLATILFSDEKFISYGDADAQPRVQLLENFQYPAVPESLLQLKLTDILNEPNILYLFMAYLKQTRSPLNFLQFVMDAKQLQDSFGSGTDSASWSFECWELFKAYFHEGSQDRIEFPAQIYAEFKSAVESLGEKNSAAIDAMKSAIMKSYKFVYDQLSSQYVYRFSQSAAFWQNLIGNRELSEELIEKLRLKNESQTVAAPPSDVTVEILI